MSNVTLVTATIVSTLTQFTTYCPLSTTLTFGNETVVTSGSVILSSGPYTVTSYSTGTAPVETTSAESSPVEITSASTASIPANISHNGTYVEGNGAAAAYAGASLAGVFAVAAFLL